MGSSYAGFWSYVHEDDNAERGRIVQLGRDVVAQYEMTTGDKIELFLDKDGLIWGDEWRAKLDEHLNSAGFFIPVMTPRYFLSAECRHEFHQFALNAKKLGIEELLLPIYYVTVPEFDDDSGDDELIKIAQTFQRKDWRSLRFEDIDSKDYRSSVAEIASHLANANRVVEDRNKTLEITKNKELIDVDPLDGDEESRDEENNQMGIIDQIALAEIELPNWGATLSQISENVNKVGDLFQSAAKDIERSDGRGGFSERVKISKRLAVELSEPTAEISRLADQCMSQAMKSEEGIRIIIQKIAKEIESNPDAKPECCQVISNIKEMCESASSGFEASKHMIDSISDIENISRDLRPVIRRLRKALTTMSGTRSVTEGWKTLINDSGVDCPEA